VKNFRLSVQYDGTNFQGWQIQKGGRTVQGVLEETLARLLGEAVRLVGAGRTDAGAHALGQVANFHSATNLPASAVFRGLSALVPRDIGVARLEEATSIFHARFDARSRIYAYRIRETFSPLRRLYTWTPGYRQDWNLIREATAHFEGQNDFRSFASLEGRERRTLCTVSRASWRQEQEEMVFEIEADRFLPHMVRAMVGTLVEVGRGRYAPGQVEEMLRAAGRQHGGPTAPPQGLYLVAVTYE
jgi:tRNA pseudouridine38-40 synthase